MTALRLARGHTRRPKVVKFSGCYHGHLDSLLQSDGVPQNVLNDTINLELGDLSAVQNAFERSGEEIAALIIEPLPANFGLLPQEKSFLQELRRICDQYQNLADF